MPSLTPGYEYDIFISYRHNDNLDSWVTDFVQALENELRSTLKDSLTIYFDKNPHDGLLETHNVDKSLEGKLKCLIFIPILSQTYCDPKSFAWQHEFLAFNKLAKEDQFGRDIKLTSGNVASRILPIKIHDIDSEDKALLENELGGVLRAIEFIFKSSGVNRPLNAKDDEVRTAGKILYRDQINKVANAVKEIVAAIMKPPAQVPLPISQQKTKLSSKGKYAIALLISLLIFTICYFLYPKFTSSQTQPPSDKSIAVLPFVDMSAERNQEYLGDGLAEDIITALSGIKDLKVIGRTSSFQFKGEKVDLREVGQKLSVSTVLEGSIMKSGNKLRITAQLINVKDGTHIWSERFERSSDDLFAVHDEISRMISEKMKVTMLGNEAIKKQPTKNMDAYNAFVQGRFFYESNIDTSGTTKAIDAFKEAIRIDSSFALPWTYLSMCYWRKTQTFKAPMHEKAKAAAERALELDPSLSIALVNMAEILDTGFDLAAAYDKIQLALRLDPENPYVLRNAGRFYTLLGRQAESIAFCLQALQNDPIQRTAMMYLATAYFYAGDYVNALATADLYEKNWAGNNLRYIKLLCQLENNQTISNVTGYPEVEILLKFKTGNSTEALALCEKLAREHGHDRAYSIARAYAYGNENEKSLSWLERAWSNGERRFGFIKVDPYFKKFQSHPRFKELLRKIKFPDV